MSHIDAGKEVFSVTVASLDQLILLVHSHGQQCPLTPTRQPDPHRQDVKERALEEDPETSMKSPEADLCFSYICEGGHSFSWRPGHSERDDNGEPSEGGSAPPSAQRRTRERRRKVVKQEEVCRRSARRKSVCDGNTGGFRHSHETEQAAPCASGENEEAGNLGYFFLIPSVISRIVTFLKLS